MHFPKDSFDEEQLSVLQTALELTCSDLGIGKDDSATRQKIAAAMMCLAKAGQFDIERLRVYARNQTRLR